MTLLIETPRKKRVPVESLIEKLYRTEGKAEIVNGEIVEFMSTGDQPSSAATTADSDKLDGSFMCGREIMTEVSKTTGLGMGFRVIAFINQAKGRQRNFFGRHRFALR